MVLVLDDPQSLVVLCIPLFDYYQWMAQQRALIICVKKGCLL